MKIFLIISIVIFICLLSSCKSVITGIPSETTFNNLIHDETNSPVEPLPYIAPEKISYEEYIQVIIDGAMNGIYGFVLDGNYIYYADSIMNHPNTFAWVPRTSEMGECIQEYEKTYKYETGIFKTTRPPVLYYVVQKMGITRDEIEQYNKELGIDAMPQELVDGLFVEDVNEAMQIFKSPFAFYGDGNVYNIYDIWKLSDEQIDSLNIADDEFIKTAELIIQYVIVI